MLHTPIPLVSYAQLITKEQATTILHPEPLDGNTTLFELVTMCKLVKTLGVKRAFEIGTFNGRTTINIAANMLAGGKVWNTGEYGDMTRFYLRGLPSGLTV